MPRSNCVFGRSFAGHSLWDRSNVSRNTKSLNLCNNHVCRFASLPPPHTPTSQRGRFFFCVLWKRSCQNIVLLRLPHHLVDPNVIQFEGRQKRVKKTRKRQRFWKKCGSLHKIHKTDNWFFAHVENRDEVSNSLLCASQV